jgi:hypothetical protein
MSIESVRARIEEIHDRLRSLSPEKPTELHPTEQVQRYEGIEDAAPLSHQPFPIALAQAQGQVKVREMGHQLTPQIEALVEKYSRQNGLNPDLVRAVILAESDGDPACRSPKGAMGLMQLMPSDVEGYGVRDPFDPEENIAAGTRQLADKLRLFNGDERLALAAYNAGTGKVRRYGGVPPFQETQNYIRRVFALMGRDRVSP